MSTVTRIGTTLPTASTSTPPGIESSRDPGSAAVQMRDEVYRCLGRAVEVFEYTDEAGNVSRGATALAEAMGAARSDTFLRVSRKEDSKGALQRAFIDFLGPLLVPMRSRRAFVDSLMEALDYEPPVPRRRVTEDDIARGAMDWVKSLPPSMRDAARADIAHALGVRIEDLKL